MPTHPQVLISGRPASSPPSSCWPPSSPCSLTPESRADSSNMCQVRASLLHPSICCNLYLYLYLYLTQGSRADSSDISSVKTIFFLSSQYLFQYLSQMLQCLLQILLCLLQILQCTAVFDTNTSVQNTGGTQVGAFTRVFVALAFCTNSTIWNCENLGVLYYSGN